jgi:hypothetical protein
MGAFNYSNQLMSASYNDTNPGVGDYEVVSGFNKIIKQTAKPVVGNEKRF